MRNSEGGFVRVSSDISVNMHGKIITFAKQSFVIEDRIALSFAKVLESFGISYSIVAGYVAILFGRSRRSDGIDFIVESMDENRFIGLCRRLGESGFSLIQGDVFSEGSVRSVYRFYLVQGYNVRFMYQNIVVPNVEFKFVSNRFHRYSIDNAYTVVINEMNRVRIAPLELQIAYKLRLGSEKDIGDAVFLYTLFKPVINHVELERWCEEFNVDMSILGGV